jgi:adenylate kinase family enzyme
MGGSAERVTTVKSKGGYGMSTVLALAGKIASGKSTLASEFAKDVGWPYVSFGNYVRSVARESGLEETRENLQNVGDRLIMEDLEGFCQRVLAQVDWRPGQPLVIDGVRHAEIHYLLRRIVAPSKYVLTYLRVNDQIRKDRLRQEGIDDSELIERETHPTEEQVKAVLPRLAHHILDGAEPIPSLIEKLKAISSDVPPEADIPADDAGVSEVIETIRRLPSAEQREVLARLWPEQSVLSGDKVWRSVHFGDNLRVVAYTPEQEPYVGELRKVLLHGALARLENESDGTYEVYGPDRTYYVTMTPARQFAAILSSWEPDNAPHEVVLQDAE